MFGMVMFGLDADVRRESLGTLVRAEVETLAAASP
jgi:hypothetical protein